MGMDSRVRVLHFLILESAFATISWSPYTDHFIMDWVVGLHIQARPNLET